MSHKPDYANILQPEVIRRWLPDMPDATPLFLMRSLPQLMRGPLLLAKSAKLGTSDSDVFNWGRLNYRGRSNAEEWTCVLDRMPLAEATWGAWTAYFSCPTPNGRTQQFGVRVCDFQSAADQVETAPARTFNLFY